MVQINFALKEIQCKIVYYGPGMSGKTTNLELVHSKVPDEARGELTSIATTGERTLYFDYMPLDLGQIAGIQTKFQLYTVPGQIYYKSTRRLVLQGVDGVVFVADSSATKMRENMESFQDLEDNLKEMGKTLQDVPIIIQYNKRDLPDAMSIEDLERELNPHGFPFTEAVATRGDGVFPTLKQLSQSVLEAVNKGGFAANKPKRKPRKTSVKAPAAAAAAQRAPLASAGAGVGAGVGAGAGHVTSSVISRPVGGESDTSYSAPAATSTSTVGKRPPAPSNAPAPAMPSARPAPRAPVAAPPVPPAARTEEVPRSNAIPPAAGARPHTPTPGEYHTRSLDQRVVKISGLGGRNGFGKAIAIVGLALVIAATAFFIFTRVV